MPEQIVFYQDPRWIFTTVTALWDSDVKAMAHIVRRSAFATRPRHPPTKND